jgi:hypothetical protein
MPTLSSFRLLRLQPSLRLWLLMLLLMRLTFVSFITAVIELNKLFIVLALEHAGLNRSREGSQESLPC